MSHHRHTCASCRKALQTWPRQLTSAEGGQRIIWTGMYFPTPFPPLLNASLPTGAYQQLQRLGQRPLHQAKSCGFGEDTQSVSLEPRHIPPRQMTTTEKKKIKIAVSFYTDFVWIKSGHRALPPVGPSIPGQSSVYHHASHVDTGICRWQLWCLLGSS